VSEPLAVTGVGVVSAAGVGAAAFAAAARDGSSRLGPLPDAVAAGLPVALGGRVPDDVLPGAAPRALELARLAVAEALADAGAVDLPSGLALGTGLGGTEPFEAAVAAGDVLARPGATPAELRALGPAAVTGALAAELGLAAGAAPTFCATCASALFAIEQAAADLALGRCEAAVAVGLDTLSRTILAGFCALDALSRTAEAAGPPPTDGIVLGEGAAALVLERPAAARARGADAQALVAGRGVSADAVHVTSPDPEGRGMARAVTEALAMGGVRGPDVDVVTLTAPASPLYMDMYARALPDLLGAEWRARSATWEDAVGHLLGASTAAGVVDACGRIASGARRVLSLTVGFGGLNGAVLVVAPGEATR